MQKPGKIIPILIGALVIDVISSIPVLNLLNFFFCAGVIAGGIAGVYYYDKKLKAAGLPLTYKDGAIIGGMSGLVSAAALILFVTGAVLFLKILDVNLGSIINDIFSKFGIPSGRSGLTRRIVEEYRKYGFSITHIIVTSAVYGIFYPLFGLAGGILGVAFFSRKNNSVKSI
ncbi:MAG: hypothetical protein EHM58_11575 [Ignavibacteriae bacterium]|nr:MAG: hypothetical protein EHM58_11575 [Ignavibacteriota bacterium]